MIVLSFSAGTQLMRACIYKLFLSSSGDILFSKSFRKKGVSWSSRFV